MSRSYIFCQASTKIPAVLLCYEKEVEAGNKVTIVTRNAASMNSFFKMLNLNANVVYLEPIPLEGSVLLHFYHLKALVRKDIEKLGIKDYSDVRIFFTDICDDFWMGLYLSEFKQFPIMKIQGQIDIKRNLDQCWNRKNLPLLLRIKEKLFSLFLGYSFLYTRIDHWTLTINIEKYGYPLLDYSDMNVCNRYLITPPQQFEHNVLFFTEPYRNKFQTEDDYIRLNKLIIVELQKKGYKVGVKGHPRIGLPDGIKHFADFEIQPYLPAEFIALKSFDFAIGFVSTSVSSASEHIPAYSVLPMCQVTDKSQVDYWYDYLNKLSANKVFYLKDFSEIPNVNE